MLAKKLSENLAITEAQPVRLAREPVEVEVPRAFRIVSKGSAATSGVDLIPTRRNRCKSNSTPRGGRPAAARPSAWPSSVARRWGGGAGVAVAGGVGRAPLEAGRGAVSDDPGHRITAAAVLAEDLAEEAPDGGDGTEQQVSILDTVLAEGVEDAGLGQGVGEGEALAAREASNRHTQSK
jgi:hypothetical protein